MIGMLVTLASSYNRAHQNHQTLNGGKQRKAGTQIKPPTCLLSKRQPITIILKSREHVMNPPNTNPPFPSYLNQTLHCSTFSRVKILLLFSTLSLLQTTSKFSFTISRYSKNTHQRHHHQNPSPKALLAPPCNSQFRKHPCCPIFGNCLSPAALPPTLTTPKFPNRALAPNSFAMDPIKMEKIRAMERYRKIQFLQNLFQYLLTALVLAMAISQAFPSSLFSSMKLFFSVSLPSIGAFVISPKCLFIVGNAIVIFLFSESKLASRSTSSPDIYEEYVRNQQSLRRLPSFKAKEKEKGLEVCLAEGDDEEIKGLEEEKKEEEKEEHIQQKEEEKKEKENDLLEEEKATAVAAENEEEEEGEGEGGEEEEVEEDKEEEEEEAGMDADELNRKAEDFIARVTKQFRLEAQMLACGG